MANIKYISVNHIEECNGGLTSILASIRYRILIPVQQISQRHHVKIVYTPHADNTWAPEFINDASADILIFSKTLHVDNEKLAQAQRARGQQVVVDMCDNYFNHIYYGDKWKAHFITMCHLANQVITSTYTLAEIIKEHTGRDATVISDPVEGIKNTPLFIPTFPRLKLLWFGHDSNFASLINSLDDLLQLSKTTPLHLTVVTALAPDIENYIHVFNRDYGSTLTIDPQPWSVETTWQNIKACDVVIIPSMPDAFFQAKSPNRLIEALWGGRFVVAHAIPSYNAYASFCWLGEKISDGIRYAINNPALVHQQIKNGQDYISEHHSSYKIANDWEKALQI